ncbi:MAG TPA: adenylate/guanylate cyclase domain-containing protein [Candidatus Dormibacteraeota bacterium]|nr:adenylate/guanylate cyclase domain-containing protein [Candidatus Dormibacteraeota bacterium]
MPEANPPSNRQRWLRRFGFSLYTLFLSWWRHRVSFVISVGITLAALTLYYFTFLGEKPTPILGFLQRLEFVSLDARFRYRPAEATPSDTPIVIVDIDQHSQEVLGRWPFARSRFADLLDALRTDGAKVAAFDITFSKPDQSGAAVENLWKELEAREKRGERIDPKLRAQVREIANQYDGDAQFASAIRRFGAVILGSYFLYTDADMRGMDEASLNAYAEQLAFFSFPKVKVVERRAAFGQQDRIHLIEAFGNEHPSLLPPGAEANLPILTSALSGDISGTGFFNAPSDQDGVVRRATTVLPYGRSKDLKDWDIFGSLDVMSAASFLRLRSGELALYYNDTGVVSIDFGPNLRIVPNPVGMLTINYRGPAGTFDHRSMADVVGGKVPAGTFRDKLVLIGATATGIGDLKTTPYGGTDYPGIEIHANVIDNILNQRFLKRGQNQFKLDVLFILLFGIPLGTFLALVSPRWMWFGVALMGPLVGVDYYAFLHGWWLNFTVPAMTLASNVLLVSLYRALIEEKEKRRVRTAFGQYLSPEVIRRLLLNPRLVDPKKTEISVMFSDIRGFTTISEKLDAQDLAVFLNQYLSDMTRLVFEHHGTLDKYIGDAVMAFWGAPFEEPGHATRACNTALKMMERVREMQKKWEAEGKPHLDIGIGLNTGVASVGNMGSALRYGYTALGDSVNLSSRLEGLNKEYGTHILANETTFEYVKADGFVFRELDLMRVKGKLQPVTLYELIGRAGEGSVYGSPEEVQVRVELFAKAREMYRHRQWEEAQRAFQAMLDKWPDDGPSRMYWKRCQEYLFDEPPSGWDGVFTMTHK